MAVSVYYGTIAVLGVRAVQPALACGQGQLSGLALYTYTVLPLVLELSLRSLNPNQDLGS
jgi:hypothetical protein